MRRRGLLAGALAAALAAGAPAAGAPALAAGGLPELEPAEMRRILQHGPWPPPAARDPSNRVSGDARAAALGQRLFFDTRLSPGGVACGSCHVPAHAWADARPRGVGLAPLDRNTPGLLDAALHRWLGWDGGADSLWAQAARALLDPREMNASAGHVASVLAADPALSCGYAGLFGAPPRARADDERVLVDAVKALAAFVETLRSNRTPFDDFRDALARGDVAAAARYPAPALRGLRIFVGAGRCSVCHVGPHFTNGEFHDVGIPYALGPGRVDAGRHAGLKRLRADPLNLLGPHSDDATGESAVKTRHVEPQHANFGQFRTPSLRNVALTAPYMHDGRLATLREVVQHYSRLDMERLHVHGEQLLRPLRLTEAQVDDLAAFLESLTAPGATAGPPPPPPLAGCGAPR